MQADDLRPLETAIAWLQIPDNINGKVVWMVVYNGNGDALFLSATTPSVAVPESNTKVSFSSEGIFVGGRGKYENASGTYNLTGFFNPQDANEAGYSINGELSY